jgi:PTS system mannose-specific IIA component
VQRFKVNALDVEYCNFKVLPVARVFYQDENGLITRNPEVSITNLIIVQEEKDMLAKQTLAIQTGIIVVTHVDYGSALLRAAELIFGPVHDCTCIQIDASVIVETTVSRLKEAVERLNTGNGVLVLTDMFGGTSTNLSLSLLGARDDVEVLTGVNLPMLLRVLSNRTLPLAEQAQLALKAGCDGIIAAGQVLQNKVKSQTKMNE